MDEAKGSAGDRRDQGGAAPVRRLGLRDALAGFALSPTAGAIALLVTAVVEVWALYAADPDFWFPDPFRWLVIYLVAVFVVTGWFPSRVVRLNARVALGLVPIFFFMGLDAWFRLRPADGSGYRVERTPDDALLRYHYRPTAEVHELDRSGQPIRITSDGLWDEARPVEKAPGTYRVVVLGDSVPNDPGVPFAERFPRVLEARLRAQSGGRPVEVINVSCEGYNTLQEVRLLERVGLRYRPDLVVLAYVLNDPFLQNGGDRRVGNSFALFQVAPLFLKAMHRNTCTVFAKIHAGYPFDLMVREPMERLRLLSERHHFAVAVALLPLLEPFDDVDCAFAYNRATEAARSSGLPVLRIIDGLAGDDYHRYLKPRDPMDITHPNALGHARIADDIARFVAPLMQRSLAPADGR